MDRQEYTDIDIGINNLKTIYTISDTYKTKQRTNTGKTIPFEEIDMSLYKTNANCVCFITSNSRIHAWISAIAEVIYLQEGSGNKNVVWTDKKDNKNKIVQTEFVISDNCISDCTDPDDFMYKVIIYLSTGKILIQGKLWESFCNQQFKKCKLKVDSLLNTPSNLSSNASVSENPTSEHQKVRNSETSSAMSEKTKLTSNAQPEDRTVTVTLQEAISEETIPKWLHSEILDHKTLTECIEEKSEHTNKSKKTPPHDNGLDKTQESNSEFMQQTFTVFQNRLDVVEESLVKITQSLSNLLTLQSNTKTDIISEVQDLIKSIKFTHSSPDLKLYESQLSEKNNAIEKLKREINLHHIDKENVEKIIRKEFEQKHTELHHQLTEARKSKINSDLDNEKLAFLLEKANQTSEEIKSDLKARLDEKDVVIQDLQDRIQTYLYDCHGEPWNKVQNYNKPSISNSLQSQDNEEHPENVTSKENMASNGNHSVKVSTLNEAADVIEYVSKPNVTNQEKNTYSQQIKSDGVIFMHDSICHMVDMKRLLAGSGKEGSKHTTYTIEEAFDELDRVTSAETIIIHVGINNLKRESETAQEAFNKYADLLCKALEKSDMLVISLVIPTKYSGLNRKIQEFNERLVYRFQGTPNIKICRNSNFTSNGRVLYKLFQNATKLNTSDGIRVLAGNLRNTLFPRIRNQIAQNTQNLNVHRDSQNYTPKRNMRNENNSVGNYRGRRNADDIDMNHDYPLRYPTYYKSPSASPLNGQGQTINCHRNSLQFDRDNLAASIASAVSNVLYRY